MSRLRDRVRGMGFKGIVLLDRRKNELRVHWLDTCSHRVIRRWWDARKNDEVKARSCDHRLDFDTLRCVRCGLDDAAIHDVAPDLPSRRFAA